MTPQWTLGDRIRRARLSAGMDRLELAGKLGVSRAAVGYWETDRSQPKDIMETLRQIAEITGVGEDWLFGIRTGSRCFDETDIPDVSWEAAARARHPTSHDVPATCQSDVA